jgi:hypothetical protein
MHFWVASPARSANGATRWRTRKTMLLRYLDQLEFNGESHSPIVTLYLRGTVYYYDFTLDGRRHVKRVGPEQASREEAARRALPAIYENGSPVKALLFILCSPGVAER